MSKTQSVRIFIVDDHPLIRRGLRQLFESDAAMQICGEAETIHDSLPLIRECMPDLVVVDISLPDGSGLDLIKRIKAINPNIPVLVSSMHDEQLFAERALHAGAMGYINKQEASEFLIEAVQRILSGKIYVSHRMTEQLLTKNLVNNINNINNDQAAAVPIINSLSNRELEVFEQIGNGNGTAQIATHLNLSIKTVETHRANIKRKLGVSSATELTRRAVQWSLEKS